MKKLTLDLDRLAVESFGTSEGHGADGTVFGAGHSETTCDQIACDCATNGFECRTRATECDCGTLQLTFCYESCLGTCPTCGSSCEGTCGGAETCDDTVCWCITG